LIIVGLVALSLIFYIEHIDILADIEEIRNNPIKERNELNQFHTNTYFFDSLVSSGKYDPAFEFINKIINNSLHSDFHDNYIFEKGKLLFNLENYENAKRVFTEAINLSDSSHLKSFVWRGYSFALLGNCDSALVDLEFAVNRNPSFQLDYDKVLGHCGD